MAKRPKPSEMFGGMDEDMPKMGPAGETETGGEDLEEYREEVSALDHEALVGMFMDLASEYMTADELAAKLDEMAPPMEEAPAPLPGGEM